MKNLPENSPAACGQLRSTHFHLKSRLAKNWFMRLSALVLLPALLAFVQPSASELTCDPPQNATWVSPSSGALTVSWDAVSGVDGYVVKLVRQSDGFESQEFAAGNTYTFTGLASGQYKAFVASICGTGVSGFIVISEIIM